MSPIRTTHNIRTTISNASIIDVDAQAEPLPARTLKRVDPLPKGFACLPCAKRRVKCSGERPACKACVRHASWQGKDKRKNHGCCYKDEIKRVEEEREEEELVVAKRRIGELERRIATFEQRPRSLLTPLTTTSLIHPSFTPSPVSPSPDYFTLTSHIHEEHHVPSSFPFQHFTPPPSFNVSLAPAFYEVPMTLSELLALPLGLELKEENFLNSETSFEALWSPSTSETVSEGWEGSESGGMTWSDGFEW